MSHLTYKPAEILIDYRKRGLTTAHLDDECPYLSTTLDFTAANMPAATGRPVLEELRSRRCAGPVIARPGVPGSPDRWSVLCWDDYTIPVAIREDLDRVSVSVCTMGSPLPLPTGYSREPGSPWWIQPPGGPLPRLSVVIAVVQQIVSGSTLW